MVAVYIYTYIFAFEIDLALVQIMIYPKKLLDGVGTDITLEFNVP